MDGIREHSGTAIWIGVLLLLGGALAIAAPLATGLSITLAVGILLAVGGVGVCLLAFRMGALGRGILVFLIGALTLVTGIYLITQPVARLASITLLLAAYFVATGILALIAGLQSRPVPGWGWMVADGVVTLLLGLLIWQQFPLSGAWALGVLFGIKLLFTGSAILGLAMAVRRSI